MHLEHEKKSRRCEVVDPSAPRQGYNAGHGDNSAPTHDVVTTSGPVREIFKNASAAARNAVKAPNLITASSWREFREHVPQRLILPNAISQNALISMVLIKRRRIIISPGSRGGIFALVDDCGALAAAGVRRFNQDIITGFAKLADIIFVKRPLPPVGDYKDVAVSVAGGANVLWIETHRVLVDDWARFLADCKIDKPIICTRDVTRRQRRWRS